MEILREQYEKEVVPAMMKKFNYKSVMEVPKLDKIVINIGLGDTKDNPKSLENAVNDFLNSGDFDIVDIKYNVAIAVCGEEQIYCFSAMILYN